VLKKPANETLEKVIRTTTLIDDSTKADLKKLLIDRNHVAHGRAPYLLNSNPEHSIERYIAAARKVLEAYLSNIPHGTWPEVMTMRIGRTQG